MYILGLNFILFVLYMSSKQSNTEYDYNTTTIKMGFRRKSNGLFESVSQILREQQSVYILSQQSG